MIGRAAVAATGLFGCHVAMASGRLQHRNARTRRRDRRRTLRAMVTLMAMTMRHAHVGDFEIEATGERVGMVIGTIPGPQ